MSTTYDATKDFEFLFADPPDAAKLLKHVLSKQSVRAIEKDRGVEYTRVSDSDSSSSSSSRKNDKGKSTSKSEDQDDVGARDSSPTDNTKKRFRKLNPKKDGSNQRFICLVLRYLLTQIPLLMNKPLVHTKKIQRDLWVGCFSTSMLSMERMVQSLESAEPQLAAITVQALSAYYNRTVKLGEDLLERLGGPDNDDELKWGHGKDSKLKQRQQQQGQEDESEAVQEDEEDKQAHKIRRTFISEATIQLARLDLEYRTRLVQEAEDRKNGEVGSRKRKADLTFADDQDEAMEGVDGDAADKDGEEEEENLDGRGIYRLRKRVAAEQSPLSRPVPPSQSHKSQSVAPGPTVEAPSSSSPSSPPLTVSLPSTPSTQEQQKQPHQQGEPGTQQRANQDQIDLVTAMAQLSKDLNQLTAANDKLFRTFNQPRPTPTAQLSQHVDQAKTINDQLPQNLSQVETTPTAQLFYNLNQAKATNDQLYHSSRINAEGDMPHLAKTLASLKEMLTHTRQKQRDRYASLTGSSSSDAHSGLGKANSLAKAAITVTPPTIVALAAQQPKEQQPQPQQQDFSHQDSSSTTSNMPTTSPTATNTHATTAINTTAAVDSMAKAINNNSLHQTANYPPGSFQSLENMIQIFGQDIKTQIAGLKNAFENQQLQMVHLQSAVEDQQTQLTTIRETLATLVTRSASSNNSNGSNYGGDNNSGGGDGNSGGGDTQKQRAFHSF
ncbi:hypothetical protein BGW39_006876 [Mortierella sp. 14UC]|nr:hypothetical protein BGW39_006876 [Mortierella sp. 14UC]